MTDASERFDRITERATSDPDAASVADLVDAVRAAKPTADDVDAARRAFVAVASADADAASRSIDALVDLLNGGDVDDDARPAARVALANVCMEYPEEASPAVSTLFDAAADDDPQARDYAFNALNAVAMERPAALAREATRLRPCLTDESDETRGMALAVVAELARNDPSAVAELAPALEELVTADRTVRTDHERFRELPDQIQSRLRETEARQMRIRMIAALTLVEIAEADPDAAASAARTLAERLPDESNLTVREATYDLVWRVGAERPDAVSPAVEVLAARLDAEDDDEIGGKAARSLAILADADPTRVVAAVRPHAASLRELVASDDPMAQGGATGLLAYVAEVAPELVEPSSDRLWELATDGPTYVRGNAIWCLAYLGGDDVAAQLSDLAESASDGDVRAVADEAAHLASRR